MTDPLDRLVPALAGRYHIEREIGAGGMATVYLARDLRHDRHVAVKVLNPELGVVLGAERFLSEIRTTANLQHPHVLPLFDSGQADGALFYVMPFVDGESLRARLDRERQLPVEEALRIAVALAGALAYAHNQRVVHRDLKPENILLHAGQPVIADFGISLAMSNASGARMTQTGLTLGTPAYMSPEQAMGDRALDNRTDIYALGVVLYEMLVGEPPHAARSAQATVAKVLTEPAPNVRAVRPSVPAHVATAVATALEKLPADRFATASAFADALQGARPPDSLAAGEHRAHTSHRSGHAGATIGRWLTPRVAWVIAGLSLLVTASALPGLMRRSPGAPAARFAVEMGDSVGLQAQFGHSIALSPDGSMLAMLANVGTSEQLLLRRIDEVRPRRIIAGGVSDIGMSAGAVMGFSPDSRWILVGTPTFLRKVAVTGDDYMKLADRLASGPLGAGASWSTQDEIVFSDGSSIWRVGADGATPILVARPDSGARHLSFNWPDVLPNGQAALVTVWKGTTLDQAELALVDLSDGRVTDLGITGTNPRYVAGHLLFARSNGAVYAAPFSLRRRRPTGDPVLVLEGVVVKANGAAEFTVAENGTLAYIMGETPQSRLQAVSRSGVARSLSTEVRPFQFPRVSPDGRRIAVTLSPRGLLDIWTLDLASQALTPLTQDGESQRAEWLPDRQHLVYVGREGTDFVIKQLPWDGSGRGEIVARPGERVLEVAVGPLHGHLAYRVGGGASRRDILVAPLDSPAQWRPLIATAADEWSPTISPDGQWIAYVTSEPGRSEVFVRPLTGAGGRIQVSAGGGVEPRWAPEGLELLYRGGSHLMSARLVASPQLTVEHRDTLFADLYRRNPSHPMFDVFPGGRELLMLREETDQSKLYVVVNWTEELRRKMRGR